MPLKIIGHIDLYISCAYNRGINVHKCPRDQVSMTKRTVHRQCRTMTTIHDGKLMIVGSGIYAK